ncbi:MAG: ribonuclease HII [Omnitrophica bacterium RBG_13_46_9]|nr:MAG: ribonuclease HII [Omnitrophica bacterium RBG_13_46_9]
MLHHERKARKAGFTCIAGIDEVGRGPLAGPVVAASLVLRDEVFTHRIDDSKKLTPRARSLAYREIIEKAWIGIGIVSEGLIDRINIYNATVIAMEMAIRDLSVRPDFLLIDGRLNLKSTCKKSCIIKGDSKSLSIACASIIAKVTRDSIMLGYHEKYPQYGFARNKGYGTKEHIKSLNKYGPSPIHRLSFNPVRRLVASSS